VADWKKIVLFPIDLATLVVRIAGRITAGVVGFVLMGGGLFLIEPLHLAAVGIPLFILGLLLTLRAVF
jgi:hypothetical protein